MNYTIVRSHRRTMAIQIKRDGRVVVRAPYAATDEEVRQLVEKHRDWIEKSLARQREAPAASPPELTEQEMEELRRRGCMFLVTTHYPQVKSYAEITKSYRTQLTSSMMTS